MHFCQIQHNLTCCKDLCKLGKEYLNALTCKYYSLFHITHYSPINHCKVINSQKQSVFWPTLYF